MKHNLTYWRWVYRTTGGWRGVRWCLNCHYGPRKWKHMVVDWWRDRRMRRMFSRMTPKQRAEAIAALMSVSPPKGSR